MSSATPSSQPHPSTSADGLETPRRYWAIATMMAALVVASLDATMANVALPVMASDLGIDPASIVWVMIAYSLAVVVSLLPFSAVAERIGFRRMFALGLTVFMLGALACALSSSFVALISARVAQGFGASMLMCLLGGLVRHIYPLRNLGFGVSLSALMVGLMAVMGPTIGAFILQITSWRWIFAIYVPICCTAYFGIRFLPDVSRHKRPFDWWACILSVLAFGLSVIGLDTLPVAPLRAALCLLVAVAAAVLLVHRSRGQTAPLVPVDLLRIKPVAYAVAASAFSYASQMAAFVVFPFYFLNTLNYSYAEVGFLLGAWAVGVAVMAPVAGYLADRYLVAVLCSIGAACTALGLLWVLLLPVGAGFAWVMTAMLLGGVGFGFFQSPNNRALLAGAPKRRSGAAGALQATTRVFGQSLGTALAALGFNLSSTYGAQVGLTVGIVCAVGALAVNVARYFSPAPDLEI